MGVRIMLAAISCPEPSPPRAGVLRAIFLGDCGASGVAFTAFVDAFRLDGIAQFDKFTLLQYNNGNQCAPEAARAAPLGPWGTGALTGAGSWRVFTRKGCGARCAASSTAESGAYLYVDTLNVGGLVSSMRSCVGQGPALGEYAATCNDPSGFEIRKHVDEAPMGYYCTVR